jgi:hypothetical protein
MTYPIENLFRNHAPARNRPRVAAYTVDGWKAPKNLNLVDYCLRYLATGVVRSEFPSGLDRGPSLEPSSMLWTTRNINTSDSATWSS